MSDRLVSLSSEFGQSPWVDNLKRAYLRDGTLLRLVERGVRGVTSNPTIFQKAIAGSTDYDEQLGVLVGQRTTPRAAFWLTEAAREAGPGSRLATECDRLLHALDERLAAGETPAETTAGKP